MVEPGERMMEDIKKKTHTNGTGKKSSDLIPTNWCDPLLTGPQKVIGSPPYWVGDIGALLLAIRRRIIENEQ